MVLYKPVTVGLSKLRYSPDIRSTFYHYHFTGKYSFDWLEHFLGKMAIYHSFTLYAMHILVENYDITKSKVIPRLPITQLGILVRKRKKSNHAFIRWNI